MKITQVISDTNVGGAGVLLTSIVSALKNDFEFEIILPSASLLNTRFPTGVRISELRVTGDRSFSASDIAMFVSHFKKSRPDIIHTHASLSARIAARLSCDAACFSTRHCSKPSHSIVRFNTAQRALYNFSTDITVSTADYATDNLIREGVPARRIITIKNGSPDLSANTENTDMFSLKELGLAKNTILIGSVARLESIKGQDIILRAAPKILSRFPNVHFLFLGEGSMKEEYKRLSASLGIEKQVTFFGFAENPKAYQKLFFLNVNASRGTETSCLATSECLSLGIPTVASDFGGNTEMIDDMKNGLIFPSDNPHALAECIIRLIFDRALYEKLRLGARKSYLEHFSLDKMAEKYRALYSLTEQARESGRRNYIDEVYQNMSRAAR